MDPDKQIVRGHGDGRINLAVGEPFFLHPHMRALVQEYDEDLDYLPTYPQYIGQPELLEVLRRRHPGYEVVVCTGAKQAILAGLYALRRRYGFSELAHRVPHWPSYPTMASLSAMKFTHTIFDLGHKPTCLALSSPNNPDSWTAGPDTSCHLWDAAYAHPVYGWSEQNTPQHEVSVWSAAKLLGLSGLRVGWLLTKDSQMAGDAADYVEKTTSGVNVDAQLRVASTLAYIEGHEKLALDSYRRARLDLIQNGNAFLKHLEAHCRHIEGLPINHCGMFAWFYAFDPEKFATAVKNAGVALVEGRACGAQEPGWYRMSLGHHFDVLNDGLQKLVKALQ